MSTLKIWETVRASNGLPVIRLDARTNYQAVSFTGTAGTSVAFDVDTSIITISADAACAIAVGTAPTAVTTDYPLAANTLMDLEVEPGAKISVIAT
jgi:hypothetical protein